MINNYKRRKKITYPRPSEKLAEFLGLFLGDGSFRNRYQITISYNHISEVPYSEYVEKLVLELFGLKSARRIRKKYGSAELVITSSNLVDFLRKTTAISEGTSKNKTILPEWLFRSKKCQIGFVRGFFDAEGCIYKHRYFSNNKRYAYIKIAITNYCAKLLATLSQCFNNLKIHYRNYNNRIHIYSQEDVRQFLNLIGTNNTKKLSRLAVFVTDRRGTQAGLRGGLAKPVVGSNP